MSSSSEAGRTILLYHLLALNNLPSLFKEGRLFSKNQMIAREVNYASIAHDNIQSRRGAKVVPVGRGGTIHDYVPFYFAPRSPMLSALHNGKVEVFTGSQADLAYLVTTVDRTVDANLDVVFTRRSCALKNPEFNNDLKLLDSTVDWQVMTLKYWIDTKEDGDIKARRQAEFLVWNSVPIEAFAGIGVYSDSIAKSLSDSPLIVKPKREWYF